MDVSEFDFDLPANLIAQEPPAERGSSRLLHLDRESGHIDHRVVSELPSLLSSGDVLVLNDTRVFPARLLGHRTPSGGAVECLLVAELEPGTDPSGRSAVWEALMHPGQKLKVGAQVRFDGHGVVIRGEILDRRFHGRRIIRLWLDETAAAMSVDEAIDAMGHVPLPPYIKRVDRQEDRDRYQTVFAAHRGSVAAPTAGLHFTAPILARIRAAGVEVTHITLHVGYGTFQPVRVARVEEHRLEPERYEVNEHAARIVNRALDDGRRIVTVGTTTTRTLEAVARGNDGRMAAGAGTTDLFIAPGFEFRVVSGLLTNFHLPRSSLLMLVSALAGKDLVLRAYSEAVQQKYRFYSYGDAMLIL